MDGILPPGDPDDPSDEGVPPAWMEESFWAQRGQLRPLIKSLRAGKAIPANAEFEIREFLADFLAGKIKRPRKRPPPYSRGNFGIVGPRGAPNDLAWVKDRYAPLCCAAAVFWHEQRSARASGRGVEAARETALKKAVVEYKEASTKAGLVPARNPKRALENWLNRSTAQRRKISAL
jgi:hypothetical protein